jgi:hypothetical protein
MFRATRLAAALPQLPDPTIAILYSDARSPPCKKEAKKKHKKKHATMMERLIYAVNTMIAIIDRSPRCMKFDIMDRKLLLYFYHHVVMDPSHTIPSQHS